MGPSVLSQSPHCKLAFPPIIIAHEDGYLDTHSIVPEYVGTILVPLASRSLVIDFGQQQSQMWYQYHTNCGRMQWRMAPTLHSGTWPPPCTVAHPHHVCGANVKSLCCT